MELIEDAEERDRIEFERGFRSFFNPVRVFQQTFYKEIPESCKPPYHPRASPFINVCPAVVPTRSNWVRLLHFPQYRYAPPLNQSEIRRTMEENPKRMIQTCILAFCSWILLVKLRKRNGTINMIYGCLLLNCYCLSMVYLSGCIVMLSGPKNQLILGPLFINDAVFNLVYGLLVRTFGCVKVLESSFVSLWDAGIFIVCQIVFDICDLHLQRR